MTIQISVWAIIGFLIGFFGFSTSKMNKWFRGIIGAIVLPVIAWILGKSVTITT